MVDSLPRPLKHNEVLDLGGKRVRWLDTPHVPHNWDAGLIYEETTGTLFSSDLFTQTGPADPTTETDIVAPAIAVDERLTFMPPTPMAEPTLRRLAVSKHAPFQVCQSRHRRMVASLSNVARRHVLLC
jgi:flavorubredoxin